MTMTKTAVLQAAIKGLTSSEYEREQLIITFMQELVISQYEKTAMTSSKQVLSRLQTFMKKQEKKGKVQYATCTYTGDGRQVVTNGCILFLLKDNYPLAYDKEKAIPVETIDRMLQVSKEPQTEAVTIQRAAIKAAKALKAKYISIGNCYFSLEVLDNITNICGEIQLNTGETELQVAFFKSSIADGLAMPCTLDEQTKQAATKIEMLQDVH